MSNENAFYVEAPRYRSSTSLIFDLIGLKPVAIGTITPPIHQPDCCIAIGQYAGFWEQGACAVAIGEYTGHTSQGADAVAIGSESGRMLQGDYSVAVGSEAGKTIQGDYAVAIGNRAGMGTQGMNAVAIGNQAGQHLQQTGGIALGNFAGNASQGLYSIAIGSFAGQNEQHDHSIILNASGNTLNSITDSSFYVDPIRLGSSGQILYYNDVTKEILKGGLPSGSIPSGTYHGDYLHWDSSTMSWSLGTSSISLGSFAGEQDQSLNSVALGFHSGEYTQSLAAIAIGPYAGQASQGQHAIAIGQYAGQTNQNANSIILNASGVALNSSTSSALYVNPIRNSSTPNVLFYNPSSKEVVYDSISNTFLPNGNYFSDYLYWDPLSNNWEVGSERTHLGQNAGQTGQSSGAIAIGVEAGRTGQCTNAIAIGVQAGYGSQGQHAIAIGQYAGQTNQNANSIILNASGVALNSSTSSALYVNPIRNSSGPKALFYEPSSKEITYSDPTFSNISFQTYTYSYFQARDAVMGKFMFTDCADKDGFYRLRTSEPTTLFEGSTVYDTSSLFFDNDLTEDATITGPDDSASMLLTVNAGNSQDAYAARQSHFYAHYQPGKSFLAYFSFSFGSAASGIVKRVGLYDVDNTNFNNPRNGILLEQSAFGLTWYVYKGDGTFQSVSQNNWNVDPLNGSGPSGINLTSIDAERNLLGFVDLEWLGVGRVRVGFFLGGIPVICHTFNNTQYSVPYLNNPYLPIRYEVRRTVSSFTGSSTFRIVCCSIMSEGGFDPIGIVRTFQSGQLSLSSTQKKYCLAIRLRPEYPRATISPITLEIVSDLTGGSNVAFYSLYLWRPSSSNVPSSTTWSNVSSTLGGSGSFVEYSDPGQSGATDLYDQMVNDIPRTSILVQEGGVNSTSKTSLTAVNNALLSAQSNVDKTNRDIYIIVIDNNSTGNGVKYTALFTWREI